MCSVSFAASSVVILLLGVACCQHQTILYTLEYHRLIRESLKPSLCMYVNISTAAYCLALLLLSSTPQTATQTSGKLTVNSFILSPMPPYPPVPFRPSTFSRSLSTLYLLLFPTICVISQYNTIHPLTYDGSYCRKRSTLSTTIYWQGAVNLSKNCSFCACRREYGIVFLGGKSCRFFPTVLIFKARTVLKESGCRVFVGNESCKSLLVVLPLLC
jgi:hypothetical protein